MSAGPGKRSGGPLHGGAFASDRSSPEDGGVGPRRQSGLVRGSHCRCQACGADFAAPTWQAAPALCSGAGRCSSHRGVGRLPSLCGVAGQPGAHERQKCASHLSQPGPPRKEPHSQAESAGYPPLLRGQRCRRLLQRARGCAPLAGGGPDSSLAERKLQLEEMSDSGNWLPASRLAELAEAKTRPGPEVQSCLQPMASASSLEGNVPGWLQRAQGGPADAMDARLQELAAFLMLHPLDLEHFQI
ncbi:unnamed protein product, partial [Effrenium voratum]